MTVIVEQTPDMAAGTARLERPASGTLDPATLRIAVSTPDGRKHLDPSREGAAAWAPGERWFRPDQASLDGETLVLELGPSVTWHLEAHHPYRIGFRDDGGVRIDDRASWIPMRLPSRPPVPAPPAPPRDEPEPESEAEPEPPREANPEPAEDSAPAPAPEPLDEAPATAPAASTDSTGSSRKRRGIVLPAAAVLALALAAGLWFFFGDRDAPPASPQEGAEESPAPSSGPPPDAEAEETDPAPAAPSSGPEVRPPLARGTVRVFLKEKPSAAQALEEAERSGAAGEGDASFLLVKYAAREGSAEAARRMGSYYDPATHSPAAGVIAAPDPAAAADWYERAAKAGDADAMIRLAEMFGEGLLDAPDAPERRIFWLRKAAEAGSEQAKELLER